MLKSWMKAISASGMPRSVRAAFRSSYTLEAAQRRLHRGQPVRPCFWSSASAASASSTMACASSAPREAGTSLPRWPRRSWPWGVVLFELLLGVLDRGAQVGEHQLRALHAGVLPVALLDLGGGAVDAPAGSRCVTLGSTSRMSWPPCVARRTRHQDVVLALLGGPRRCSTTRARRA